MMMRLLRRLFAVLIATTLVGAPAVQHTILVIGCHDFVRGRVDLRQITELKCSTGKRSLTSASTSDKSTLRGSGGAVTVRA
jgi:hypothetical protein